MMYRWCTPRYRKSSSPPIRRSGAARLLNPPLVLAAIALSLAGARAEPAGELEIRVEPERVCLDGRKPAYLNFDLGIVNTTGRALKISQVRGLVLDTAGAVLERRILWSEALVQRGDAVPDGRETLV